MNPQSPLFSREIVCEVVSIIRRVCDGKVQEPH